MRNTMEFCAGQRSALATLINAANNSKCWYPGEDGVGTVRTNLIKTADEHPNAEYAAGIMSIVLRIRT